MGTAGSEDWAYVLGRQEHTPVPFATAAAPVDVSAIYSAAARRAPLWPWALMIVVSSWLVVNVQTPALQLAAVLPSIGAIIFAARVPGRRAAIRAQLAEQEAERNQRAAGPARARHEAENSVRQKAVNRLAEVREQVPGGNSSNPRPRSPGQAGELLAAELAMQTAPLPIELELLLPDMQHALLLLHIPEFADTRSRSGESRAGSVGAERRAGSAAADNDRVAALALRQARETFRILPHVEQVEVVVARHAGLEAEPLLRLLLSRQEMAGIDPHLHASPAEAIAALVSRQSPS
jgi:hypothetical protein